jgi:nucleolar protein 14
MGKKSDAPNNKKNKKKSRIGPEGLSMKVKASKSNPFETIWSSRKFDVLGKKRKGEERRIGAARSAAIDKRKKTLLKDYERSGKSSQFIDNRIGEQREGLGEFDKALLRSQRERQLKVSKKSKYNLSDGDEDELENGERDDFEDEVPFDDEDDESEKRTDILKQLNAPGIQNGEAGGEENRHKTKKEVMEEIIKKSKFFKAQKAKDKEEKDEMVEQLDNDFTSMVESQALLDLTQPNKMNALKALINKKTLSNDNSSNKNAVATPSKNVPSQQDKPDEYDKLFNAMVLDMRARPSDRTKTPEEIAQEEKERLEELEEQRQKRMHATGDSSDEDDDSSKDGDEQSNQRPRYTSGDDLGDDFSQVDDERSKKLSLIESFFKRGNVNESGSDDDDEEDDDNDEDEIDEEDDDDDDDEDNDEELKMAGSLKDWEQSDDDKIDTDLDDEEDEEEQDEEVKPKIAKKKQKDSNNDVKKVTHVKESSEQGELPFAIEAPKSFEEFSSLLENRTDEEIVEAIGRIRKYNAISLAAENRKKIQVFYGILLQYFSVSANKKPLNFKLLNLLVKPLMEMSMEIPYFAAICARERLHRTRAQFTDDMKNNSGKSSWPSMKTIFLLKLWSLIFPCSDFRHPVMTPVILLMCEYLMRCPILNGRDIAIGTFLCSMTLSICRQSKKFCPEAIIFLRTLLMAASEKKTGTCEDSELYHIMELKNLRPLLCIQGHIKNIVPLDFLAIMDLPEDSPYFTSDDFRVSVLAAIIEALHGFANINSGYNSFTELFLPTSKLLAELEETVPNALEVKIRDVREYLQNKCDEYHKLRRPLQMRKQKPVAIKLLNPKFEENFVKGRDYDPDRERAEMRKMKKLVRREAKGAARELRKDNYFLSEVKEKDKRRQEEERAEKYGKARAFLQEQEHAFKSGQLGKGKGGKRKR